MAKMFGTKGFYILSKHIYDCDAFAVEHGTIIEKIVNWAYDTGAQMRFGCTIEGEYFCDFQFLAETPNDLHTWESELDNLLKTEFPSRKLYMLSCPRTTVSTHDVKMRRGDVFGDERKPYVSPELEKVEVKISDDILSSSVENFSSYIDPDPGDWGDNPIIDPDDDIIW